MIPGWKDVVLGDVCDFQRGLTYAKRDEVGFSRNVVLRAINIDLNSNSLDLSDLRYISDHVAIPQTRKVARNSLIICMASGSKRHLGKVAFIGDDYDFAFGGFMGMVTPRQEIDPKYLYYWLTSPEYEDFINRLADGTNINNLRFDDLKEFRIPRPTLSEQRRIVTILAHVSEAIAASSASVKQNLQNTREIRLAYLESLFADADNGWVERRLGDLCDIKHGFAFKSEFFANRGDYVLLTPGNFHECGGYRDRAHKQKYYSGPVPSGFVLSEGDLLVAMTEQAAGLLGSPILVPESGKFLHNQRLGLVTRKPDAPWSNEFFFHVFNTEKVRAAIHGSASGVKVRHTSPGKIQDVVVRFPPGVDEQLAIDSQIKALHAETSRLETIYARKLAALDELKRSLLHHAFTGQL